MAKQAAAEKQPEEEVQLHPKYQMILDAHPEDELSMEDVEEELSQKIQLFGSGLSRLVNEQIGLKAELEKRWLDDLRHYNGKPDAETENQLKKSAKKSSIFVNLTRAKTNTGESKFADLVLPTDDRNWGIKPTPIPELAKMADSDKDLTLVDGSVATDPETEEPYKEKDLAKEVKEKAKESCDLMQDEIDDQLNEAKYNAVCREIIHDACTAGTGIIKGPMVESSAKKAWIEDGSGNWVLNQSVTNKPTATRTDYWNFFPDMSATKWEDCEFSFERHMKTKKQLRNMAKALGFNLERTREVLREKPTGIQSNQSYLNELRMINGITQIKTDNRYEIWEYHGPVEKENLINCDCKNINLDDPLEEYEGTVWFTGDTVLKVSLNHMDDDSLPYSILNWEEDDTSVFGFGIPFRMRHPQRVMNASWRMVLDNAGLSTGPQIVVNRKIVSPSDGVWELSPRKIWWLKDPKARVQDAFDTFEITSHQNELTAIFEMAHRLADEETNVPQMQMGAQTGDQQQPAMLKTLGGTQLWMASSNIMMRKAVKNFDDNITSPFIGRFYDWNMQFNQKSEIKGDFEIDARGTSVLLVREMQTRNMTEFVNIALALPTGAERLKEEGVLTSLAKGMQICAAEAIYTDTELEESAAEQGEAAPDPEMMKLQLEKEIAMQRSQDQMAEIEGRRQTAMMEREVKLMQLAVQEKVDLTKIREDNQIKKYNTDWSIRQFYEEMALKQKQGETANYGLDPAKP